MKVFITYLIISCLITANVYGLTKETRGELISLYNLTRNLYMLILGLIDDLESSEIDSYQAKGKLSEWKEQYREKTDRIPSEAQRMCDLMNEILDTTQELVDGYDPSYQRTKDLLKGLDKVKSKLLNEMTELKYKIQ